MLIMFNDPFEMLKLKATSLLNIKFIFLFLEIVR